MSKAFITGSRIFGTPTGESDIDMVVLMEPGDCDLIWTLCENYNTPRFGKLNLIVLNSENEGDVEQFAIWRRCTTELAAKKPVTRDFAVQYFKDAGITTYEERRAPHPDCPIGQCSSPGCDCKVPEFLPPHAKRPR